MLEAESQWRRALQAAIRGVMECMKSDSNPEQGGAGSGQDNTTPPGKTAGQRYVQHRRLGIHLPRKSGVRGSGRAPGTVCRPDIKQATSPLFPVPPLALTTPVTG